MRITSEFLCGMAKFDSSMCIKGRETKWQYVIIIYYKHKLRKFGTEGVGGFSPLAALLF